MRTAAVGGFPGLSEDGMGGSIPVWFLPFGEASSHDLQEHGLLEGAAWTTHEVAAILFILQLSRPAALAESRTPLQWEQLFVRLLELPAEQLRAALGEMYDPQAFAAGLERARSLGMGFMDEQVIRRRQFLNVEGQWDFDFARRYGQSHAAASYEHVRPSGLLIKLSSSQLRLIHTIEANQDESVDVQAYAGTGKTFAITEILALMPGRRFIFLADVEPKLKAVQGRFPSFQVRTSTFKSLAEHVLSRGNPALYRRMVQESRLRIRYSELAERIGMSAVGGRDATQVTALCWSIIFRFCMTTDAAISRRHLPGDQLRFMSESERDLLVSAATRLWSRLIWQDPEEPLLPVRGYHRVKQMVLTGMHVPEQYDGVLVDEGHDLTAPMVAILDQSPQTVIALSDRYQNLRGDYVAHRASIRHREMTVSLRAGPELAEHINPVLAVLPDLQTDPYQADRSKAMLVETYPEDEFPPEPVIILVADEWGVFDWLIRSREKGAGAAVVDWNRDYEAFMDDCLKLFVGSVRPEHGAISRYRSWAQLHQEMQWNPAFLRVENWLGTIGIRFGVSGLYHAASLNEFTNTPLARPLLATVFTVKNFEFPRMALSEDIYYHPPFKGKRMVEQKRSLIYTALTRASGVLYLPETNGEHMASIARDAGVFR